MDIVLLLMGLLFLLAGIALFWHQLQALIYFTLVNGKVVAIEKRTTPPTDSKKQGGPIYYPVIEYIVKGNKKTFTGSTGSSWPTRQIGESVTVLYSSQKDEARVKSLIPLIFGVIFGAVGIGLCYIFVSRFTFSLLSLAAYLVVCALIFNSGRKALKKRDISSFDELKESFRNTEMKTRKGVIVEQSNRIYDSDELAEDLIEKSKGLKYVGPTFTLIGLLSLGAAIYLGIQRANFLETAITARGEVVNLIEKRSDDSYVYYPVVEFTLPGSFDVLTFQHDSGSNPPSYTIGEQVQVLYDPENPQNAIIDAGLWNWMATGLVSTLGLLFTMVGISSVKQWKKYRKVHHI